jgi:hypothetical protein
MVLKTTDDITATLVLSTDQIHQTRTDTSVDNTIGGWANGRQTFYFNVNMRNVLGELYDKYDKFVISLVSVFIQNSATLNGARPLLIQMGGLNWINSSYNQAQQSNGYWTDLCCLLIGTGGSATGGSLYDKLSVSYVFRKGDPNVRIEFRYFQLNTNTFPTNVTLLPNANFIFKINPVKE